MEVGVIYVYPLIGIDIMRSPFEVPEEEHDFVDSMKTMAGAGDTSMREGLAVYIFTANISMGNKSLYSSDGDFLLGTLFKI